jgi:hypothetical protein
MTDIRLDEEQAAVVAKALEPVRVCAPNGDVLGFIKPAFTAADIAEAKRRSMSEGPWYTTKQVLEHLHELESK